MTANFFFLKCHHFQDNFFTIVRQNFAITCAPSNNKKKASYKVLAIKIIYTITKRNGITH